MALEKSYIVAGSGATGMGMSDGAISHVMHTTTTYVMAIAGSEFLLDNGATTACTGDSGGGVFTATQYGFELIGIIIRAETLPFLSEV